MNKATGRAEAITAGRQQNKQQYLIIQLLKKKESIKTGQDTSSGYKRNSLIFILFIYYYLPENINVTITCKQA